MFQSNIQNQKWELHKMPRIICAGLIAIDLVFDITDFPIKGTKNRAFGSNLITGGGALNAASTIASLGGQVSLVGAIGDDLFGALLRQKMADRGVDDQYVITISGAATSRSANMISPDGDRTIINYRDAALVPKHFNLQAAFPFDAALVDTRWPDGAIQIVKAARSAGKLAVVDVEAPVAAAEEALVNASHIIFSQQGCADYTGGADCSALADVAALLGGWCAIARGALPVLCHDGDAFTEVPTFPTHAVNTLGAGDVWHGAFTFALIQGFSSLEAVRWANAAASLKVRQPVVVETLPTAKDVAMILYQNGQV